MIRLHVRCVHDEQVVVVTPPVRDQIVRDPAPVIGQERVLGPPVADPVEIVREPCLEVVVRSGAGQLELAHVRDVEDARGRPHRAMLLLDARVLHRHLPAGEVDDARAERRMALVERRSACRLHRGGS